MTALSARPANALFKFLYIGNSGSGKTGSLISLVRAGYNLRVLDMDNGLDTLVAQIQSQCPDRMKQVEYQSFRDEYKADPVRGLIISGRAKAYTNMLKALNKWDDESTPAEWGAKTVFVLDSLTAVGKAAYNWAAGLDPTAKDKRQWFFSAQQSIETLLDMLTSESFQTNVIIITHLQAGKDEDPKMYASSIGSALGPKIPKFFNTLIAAEAKGIGDSVKRVITTRPTALLDLKVPDEEHIVKTYPINDGLAAIAKELTKGAIK